MPFSLSSAMRRSVSFQLLHWSYSRNATHWRVVAVPVATVDDDVASRQVRNDQLNEGVHDIASLHHELDAARLRQICDHLLYGVAANDGFALCAALEKLVHLSGGVRDVEWSVRDRHRNFAPWKWYGCSSTR